MHPGKAGLYKTLNGVLTGQAPRYNSPTVTNGNDCLDSEQHVSSLQVQDNPRYLNKSFYLCQMKKKQSETKRTRPNQSQQGQNEKRCPSSNHGKEYGPWQDYEENSFTEQFLNI